MLLVGRRVGRDLARVSRPGLALLLLDLEAGIRTGAA